MNFGERPLQEIIYGDITITHADRRSCIICGHPTGDCATETSKPTHISGVGAFKSVDEKLTHLVEEDIWEERQINPYHTARVLVVRKGRYISHERAKELGLL
jgi:hypothetical protein